MKVLAANGSPVLIQKGETKYIYIPNDGEITWYCSQQGEESRERAKCRNGVDLVRIYRSTGSSRQIDWTCYNREFVN